MASTRIIRPKDTKDHVIEKFKFKKIYLDKSDDIETNNLDRILYKKKHPKEYKPEDITKRQESMFEEEEEIKHNIQKDINNNANMKGMEKNILTKIDNAFTLIDSLKESITNMDNSKSGDSNESNQENYKKGFDDGVSQTINNFKNDYEEDRKRIIESMNNLDNYIKHSTNILDNLENELSKASIDIASEIVNGEISNHSQEIALRLTKSLMNELKDASNITIKVSNYDLEFIQSHISNNDIKIIGDFSIAKGGVIILSDSENIDGTISGRINNLKANLNE